MRYSLHESEAMPAVAGYVSRAGSAIFWIIVSLHYAMSY